MSLLAATTRGDSSRSPKTTRSSLRRAQQTDRDLIAEGIRSLQRVRLPLPACSSHESGRAPIDTPCMIQSDQPQDCRPRGQTRRHATNQVRQRLRLARFHPGHAGRFRERRRRNVEDRPHEGGASSEAVLRDARPAAGNVILPAEANASHRVLPVLGHIYLLSVISLILPCCARASRIITMRFRN